MQRSVLPVTSLAAVTLLASVANTEALAGHGGGVAVLAPSRVQIQGGTSPPRQRQHASTMTVAPEWFGSWRRGPVSLLMTRPEAKSASQVRSEQQASEFLRWFWARRDDQPATARNEFRRRFRDRLAYVNKQFSTASGGPGWSTLPGQLYLLLGPPPRVEAQRHGALAAGAFRDLTVWSYRLDHLGHGRLRVPMVRIGGTLVLVTDRNDNRTSAQLSELLRSAAADAIRQPDLTRGSLSAPRAVERMSLRGWMRVGPDGRVVADLRLPIRALYGKPVGDLVYIDFGLRLAGDERAQEVVISLQLTSADYARLMNRELRVLYWGRHELGRQPADLLVTEKASGRQARVAAMRVETRPQVHVGVAEVLMRAHGKGELVVAFLEAEEGSAVAYWLTSRQPLPAGRAIPLDDAGLHLVAVS